MNYRHAFHAGNFADVFKHAILARILVYLARKDAPFRFIDTHAGAGRYDLAGAEAQRSPEWRDGVARLVKASPPRAGRCAARTLPRAIGPLDASGRAGLLSRARRRSRRRCCAPQDRIALCEAHPEEREKLDRGARPRRPAQHRRRRRLCRAQRLAAAEGAARPRPDRSAVRGRRRTGARRGGARAGAAQMAERNLCRCGGRSARRPPTPTFSTTSPRSARRTSSSSSSTSGRDRSAPHGQEPLSKAGLLIVNPPYTLADEARVLLPWLAGLLGAPRARRACLRLADRAALIVCLPQPSRLVYV